MQRAAKFIFPVFQGVLLLGFGFRIALGLLWMFTNFTGYQYFGQEPGLLYPLFLKAFEGVGSLFHIPYYCIVYILQIAAVSGAVWMLLDVLDFGKEKVWLRIFVFLAVITDPIAAQCMFALLPNAFLAACTVAFICLCAGIYEKNGKGCVKEAAKAALIWIAALLLKKEYILFGALLALFTGICLLLKKGRRSKNMPLRPVVSGMLAAAAIALISCGGYHVLEQKGALEKQAPDFKEAMFSRFVWNTMFGLNGQATEEMLMVLSPDEVLEAGAYADSVFLETIPLLKERLGVDGAEEFMGGAVKDAWNQQKNVILHDIMWDVSGYCLPPVIAGLQMRGRGFRSLSLRNYEIMGRKTPFLAKYYMDYFVCWFPCAVFAGIVCALLGRFLRDGKREERITFSLSAGLGFSVFMAVWYTMQGAGLMDYKKAIVCMIFWDVWALWNARTKRETAESGAESEKQDGGLA